MASIPQPTVALTQASNLPTPVVTFKQRPTCPIMMVGGRFIEIISNEESKALEIDQWNKIIPRIEAVIEGSHLATENPKVTPKSQNRQYIDLTDSKITGFEIPLSDESDAKITYHTTSTTKPNWLRRTKTTKKTTKTPLNNTNLKRSHQEPSTSSTTPKTPPYLSQLIKAYSTELNNETPYTQPPQTEETKNRLAILENTHKAISPGLDSLRADPNIPLSDQALSSLLSNLPSDIEILNSHRTSVDDDKPINNIFNYINDATKINQTINSALSTKKPSVMTIKIERTSNTRDEPNTQEIHEPIYLSIFIDPTTKNIFIYNPKRKNDPEVRSLIKNIKTHCKSAKPDILLFGNNNGSSTLDSHEVHKRQILLFVNKMASTPSKSKLQKNTFNQFLSEMKKLRVTKKEIDPTLLQTQCRSLATKIEANIFHKMHVTKVLGYNPKTSEPQETKKFTEGTGTNTNTTALTLNLTANRDLSITPTKELDTSSNEEDGRQSDDNESDASSVNSFHSTVSEFVSL